MCHRSHSLQWRDSSTLHFSGWITSMISIPPIHPLSVHTDSWEGWEALEHISSGRWAGGRLHSVQHMATERHKGPWEMIYFTVILLHPHIHGLEQEEFSLGFKHLTYFLKGNSAPSIHIDNIKCYLKDNSSKNILHNWKVYVSNLEVNYYLLILIVKLWNCH